MNAGQRAFHHTDDIGDRYLGRRASQLEASMCSALTGDNPAPFELAENVQKKLERNLLGTGDGFRGDRTLLAGDGEDDRGSDRVVGLSRDAHRDIVRPRPDIAPGPEFVNS